MPETPTDPFESVEIFRAGDYGGKGKFSQDNLDSIVAQYDPAIHEAPITIDHEQEGPAYGWVKAIKRVGDSLTATLKPHADMAKAIRDGLFTKRSIELGREPLSLRALTFLGAAPPAVKGMRNIFSKSQPCGAIHFIDPPDFVMTPFDTDCREGEFVEKDTSVFEMNGKTFSLGQALAHFSPGGFGETHDKIKIGDAGYFEAKRRLNDHLLIEGRHIPEWARISIADHLFHESITAENLAKHRPDIINQLSGQGPGKGIATMSDELKQQNEALEADLKRLKAEREEAETEFNETLDKLQTLQAEKDKADRTEKLGEAIAKAGLPESAAKEVRDQFTDAGSLDGLKARIDGMKAVISSFAGNPITDQGGGESASADSARLKNAEALAKEKGISLGQAYIALERKSA